MDNDFLKAFKIQIDVRKNLLLQKEYFRKNHLIKILKSLCAIFVRVEVVPPLLYVILQ